MKKLQENAHIILYILVVLICFLLGLFMAVIEFYAYWKIATS